MWYTGYTSLCNAAWERCTLHAGYLRQTCTNLFCFILVAFPRQQWLGEHALGWLRERALVFRYAHYVLWLSFFHV